MITTLKKHGNSRALIINKQMMEALGIDENTPVQVTVRDGSMTVTATDVGLGPKEVDGHLRQLRKRYTPMLKRLAE